MKKQSFGQVAAALVLLTAGVLLLLMNIGIISWEIKEIFVAFYPAVILLVGVWLLYSGLQNPFGIRMFAGFLLLIYSGLLYGDHFGFLTFTASMIWGLWPVFLIFIGLRLLFKRKGIRVMIRKDIDPPREIKDQFKKNMKKEMVKGISIGSIEFKKTNWALEPMRMYKAIGDYYIDLSKAYIPEGETPIAISGWIGDIAIIVPDDLAIKVDARVNIGDIKMFSLSSSQINGNNIFYESPEYDSAIKKVKINISLTIGDIRIDKV
ncbi:cell wall-active antibiotics response protein LiaF [Peribacillus sp. SCS-155]|uniref:cell wall-active antibiotics response protein LiaF n=1 Tax=Peribacillus sedimenti TaxID=3115297 RepID=UPI0039063DD4